MQIYTLREKSREFDILILAEGTYPYVRGGVSSWIHHLLSLFKEYKFGLIFLGSKREEYGKIQYSLPENLVYVKSLFIFDFEYFKVKKNVKIRKDILFKIEELHNWFREKHASIPSIFNLSKTFYEDLEANKFLYSKESFNFIVQNYLKKSNQLPFIDYFWQIRNLHLPVLEASKVCKLDFSCKLIHSPSTGYAGFLGGLLASERKLPFILTEHGIYVRERKIDIYTKEDNIYFSRLLGGREDNLVVKRIWFSLFKGLARFAYHNAFKVISLFSGARKVQLQLGAPQEKTLVIPNGINLAKFSKRNVSIVKRRPVIVNIGRVVRIKDIKTFIKAMSLTIALKPELEGWIVGPTEEEPEYARECLELVNALGLKSKIKFLGFRKPEEILAEVKLLTLTSISEGMPLVILEAFACGLPVVATNVGACAELIYGRGEVDEKLGKAGEITPIANPKIIAQTYLDFLEDKKKWEKASYVAKKRVELFYSEQVFYRQYKQVYKAGLAKWPV